MTADPLFSVLLDRLAARRPAQAPYVIGLTGSVASGKSHMAARIAAALGEAVVVSTDGFLFPNAVLEARGLLSRKGFPETYDVAALAAALAAVRTGEAAFPVHSHTTYDIDPALTLRVARPPVLVLEGLSLDLRRRQPPEAPPLLDTLIYLDADEEDLERWFVERFMGFWRAAEHDPTSFYTRFRHLDEASAAQFGAMVWTTINLPNLRENILQARDAADLVVRKGPAHAIVEVR